AERDGPVLDAADLVIVKPGPGDPRDADDAKMRTMRTVIDRLLARGQPFLAVSGPSGAVPPAGHRPRLQGHRLSGHAVACRHRRPHRAGRLLQHLRRPRRAGHRALAGLTLEVTAGRP